MKWLLILFIATAFVISTRVRFTYPEHFPEPAYDFKRQPLTKEKIDLGRKLFFETRLSFDQRVSCASCHSPEHAFAQLQKPFSLGVHDSVGRRNAPALFNLAWKEYFMWDGRIDDINKQALAPLTHPSEMAMDLKELSRNIDADVQYRQLFKSAFGDEKITPERVAEALAQFELTLVSATAKYDLVQTGRANFTAAENRGYKIYQTACSRCHVEPLFTNNQLMDISLPVNEKLHDFGMFEDTGDSLDIGFFMTPSLRNLSFTAPYMHDGRFGTLHEVIQYYKEVARKDRVDRRLTFLWDLTTEEESDLLQFLKTLDDTEFVGRQLRP